MPRFRVPRSRVGDAAAPRGPRGAAAGPRPGVRRPTAPPRAPRERPADARQRAGRGRRLPGCSPRRGDVHAQRHPCLPPRRARPARRRARHGDLLLATSVEHSAVLHAGAWHRAAVAGSRPSPSTAPGVSTSTRSPRASPRGASRPSSPSSPPTPRWACASRSRRSRTATGAPLFLDACASAGRVPLPDGWSAAAVSAHKWGGPAGVGVLLVRKGARWRHPFPGDDRVDERATGFENVPAALAAAAALRATLEDQERLAGQHRALTRHLASVARSIPDTEVFLDDGPRLPHLVAFSCLYVDGEALVTELDRLGFAVASGSACTASTLEPSHVLAAMGALTHGNVRVSLGRDTEPAAVHRLAGSFRAWSGGCAPRPGCRRDPGRARLSRRALPTADHRARSSGGDGRAWVTPWPSRRTTLLRGSTSRPGAACARRSTSASGPPPTA